jgi:hypothetical protein
VGALYITLAPPLYRQSDPPPMDIYIVLCIFNWRKDTSVEYVGAYRSMESAKKVAFEKVVAMKEKSHDPEENEIYEWDRSRGGRNEIDWYNPSPSNTLYEVTTRDGYDRDVYVVVKGTLED